MKLTGDKRALVNVSEASAFLGLGRTTLYSLMARGELEFVKIGRCRRIPRSALWALVERNRHRGKCRSK